MPLATVVSYRLGGADGVSVEAGKWARALRHLGFEVRTVAGAGTADQLVDGLALDATRPPDTEQLRQALQPADVVVVENLCSLPLNPAAAEAVARVLVGRPAVLHHHDLPWQRPHLAHLPLPALTVPDAAGQPWRHVTINHLSRRQLNERGLEAVTVPNTFDVAEAPTRERQAKLRSSVRRALGVLDDERLLLQPTRAIYRKNVPGGLTLAETLGATYWLLGAAEDGYGPHLDRLLAGARCRVIRGLPSAVNSLVRGAAEPAMAHVYAACDAVVLPSIWEGFGNPAVESAIHRRPLAIGPYPVAGELMALGFSWLPLADPAGLAAQLDHPDPDILQRNLRVVCNHLSVQQLPDHLASVLDGLIALP